MDRPCGLQNLHYTYDPVGNITHIRDDAQEQVFQRRGRMAQRLQLAAVLAQYLLQVAAQLVVDLHAGGAQLQTVDVLQQVANPAQLLQLALVEDGQRPLRLVVVETLPIKAAGRLSALGRRHQCRKTFDRTIWLGPLVPRGSGASRQRPR